MKQLRWGVLVVVAACGDGGSATPDAAIDAPTKCAPKTAPLAPGMHKLFLNFDGVTLNPGPENAAANTSSLVQTAATIPAYVASGGASVRQGRIDLMVEYVQNALAPYSIDVVATRPASGPYMMEVIGGKPEDFGFPMGVLSITPHNCAVIANGVGLAFELDPQYPAIDFSSTILSDLAMLSGLGLTTRHNDCTNRTEANAIDQGTLCSFDAMATTVTTQLNCGRTPTQDEPKLLMDAFGCRD
jgi:hypothetical protein